MYFDFRGAGSFLLIAALILIGVGYGLAKLIEHLPHISIM